MPNVYKKVTLKEFSARLTSGYYKSAGNAKKAIHKLHTLTQEDRMEALKMVSSHTPGSIPVTLPTGHGHHRTDVRVVHGCRDEEERYGASRMWQL
jgi:hypothetical protein